MITKATATAFAVLVLSSLTVLSAPTAQAQGPCGYTNYCIWVDVNFVDPICWWPGDDGTYWNDWCTSSGNDHLAANAASSYHNNGAPAVYDDIRSFRNQWYGAPLAWQAFRGEKVSWVGVVENDEAESHYWYG
ncbi:hypothetical protein FHX82_007135 [Amycolatopsis bartoniae]|uniref:hypothetical protein n=1 Tax=Amycolatopsis bartoniae TaxID=941986 RepID=UPI001195A9AA|nr:hypothetical protein [Amycolatopsis bartoniae]MBB2940049.1 hypothetical protein [Amycolatopsis bartoniae]TVT10011.1 hypothetical protein FNH07_07150 [Amycolatopsis bartoniae]